MEALLVLQIGQSQENGGIVCRVTVKTRPPGLHTLKKGE